MGVAVQVTPEGWAAIQAADEGVRGTCFVRSGTCSSCSLTTWAPSARCCSSSLPLARCGLATGFLDRRIISCQFGDLLQSPTSTELMGRLSTLAIGTIGVPDLDAEPRFHRDEPRSTVTALDSRDEKYKSVESKSQFITETSVTTSTEFRNGVLLVSKMRITAVRISLILQSAKALTSSA